MDENVLQDLTKLVEIATTFRSSNVALGKGWIFERFHRLKRQTLNYKYKETNYH